MQGPHPQCRGVLMHDKQPPHRTHVLQGSSKLSPGPLVRECIMPRMLTSAQVGVCGLKTLLRVRACVCVLLNWGEFHSL